MYEREKKMPISLKKMNNRPTQKDQACRKKQKLHYKKELLQREADIQHHYKGKNRNAVAIRAQRVKKKEQTPSLKQENHHKTIKRKLLK